MNVSAKVNEPPLNNVIVWEEVVAALKKRIEANLRAKKALNKLVTGGCDEQRILRRLYMFCGGTAEAAAAAKKTFTWQRQHLKKVCKQLEEIADELGRTKAYLFDAGYDMHDDIEDRIKDYSNYLWRLGEPTLKDLASGRISGRNHHIVFLAKMSEKVTGREHYEELAELAECVRSAYGDRGSKTPYTAASIRKIVDRYGRPDIGSLCELEEIAKEREPTRA